MGNWSIIIWNTTSICNLLFIAIFFIAFGWITYFILIGSGETSKVGSYTFMISVISNIVSIMFLHEKVTVTLLVGLLLIFISITFVNRKPSHIGVEGATVPSNTK